MVHALIVESDDDTCLSLRQAIVAAGARVTIAGSLAGARAVLRDAEDVGLLVADARLPDGAGIEIAQQATTRGIPFLLVRPTAAGITVSNARGTVFCGPVLGALAFLTDFLKNLRAGSRGVTLRERSSVDPTHDRARRTSHEARTVCRK